jgi:hypothetical protein
MTAARYLLQSPLVLMVVELIAAAIAAVDVLTATPVVGATGLHDDKTSLLVEPNGKLLS